MARHARPFAFLRLGSHWVNMAMVTDIHDDGGDELTLFLSTDQARLAGKERVALDVARQITLRDPEHVAKLRKWLKLNDVE